ncbi:hypothetical protein EDB83DRAFT_2384489 [Lactarius deliciosus]|nr:hypothetical protein EDB83DRAFT_2384489 [Lactarius deliciosus]
MVSMTRLLPSRLRVTGGLIALRKSAQAQLEASTRVAVAPRQRALRQCASPYYEFSNFIMDSKHIIYSYCLAPPIGAGRPGSNCCPFRIATLAARIAARRSAFAGGSGYGDGGNCDACCNCALVDVRRGVLVPREGTATDGTENIGDDILVGV